jgi:hypothetical protein
MTETAGVVVQANVIRHRGVDGPTTPSTVSTLQPPGRLPLEKSSSMSKIPGTGGGSTLTISE